MLCLYYKCPLVSSNLLISPFLCWNHCKCFFSNSTTNLASFSWQSHFLLKLNHIIDLWIHRHHINICLHSRLSLSQNSNCIRGEEHMIDVTVLILNYFNGGHKQAMEDFMQFNFNFNFNFDCVLKNRNAVYFLWRLIAVC